MPEPIADGLFTWPTEQPQLIASRRASGGLTFPAEKNEEQVLLSREGKLFTFTTQEYPPPSPYGGPTGPGEFVRYAVGMVELPEGILIEGVIPLDAATVLSIGQTMKLVVAPFVSKDSTERVTYTWVPA